MLAQECPTETTAADQPTVEEFRRLVTEPLSDVLAEGERLGRFALLCPASSIGDSVLKFAIRNTNGRPIAVALCSSPNSPSLVARGMQRARQAKQALGPELGRVILTPMLEGDVHGLSYTVLPYCTPLSTSRLWWRRQRSRLQPAVLTWLASSALATARRPDRAELEVDFEKPLRHLADLSVMTDRVRTVAEWALARLTTRNWWPQYMLMHNDLWKGNILIDNRCVTGDPNRPWNERFVIIDWPGGQVDGYPMFDLIRLAQSLAIGHRQLHAEVVTHCRLLGCEPMDAYAYLAVAIGSMGLQLEHFPVEHYVRMSHACVEALDAVELLG